MEPEPSDKICNVISEALEVDKSKLKQLAQKHVERRHTWAQSLHHEITLIQRGIMDRIREKELEQFPPNIEKMVHDQIENMYRAFEDEAERQLK